MSMQMDEEFCEVDFTTATSWENFTARLEEIFFTWNLCQVPEDSSFENCESFSFNLDTWLRKNEKVDFEGREYEISFYHKQINSSNQSKNNDRKEDVENVNEDKTKNTKFIREYLPLDVNCLSKNVSKFGFNEKLTKLVRIYDLNDFVLLTPYTDSSNVFASETAVKLLMSSFCIAAYNTRCYVPIFLQVYHIWQNCFLGVSVNEDGFRNDYQMVHLAKVPSKLQYFSGLIDLFKSKISHVSLDDSIWASVKFSYSISDFTYFAWPIIPKPAIINPEECEEQEVEPISFSLCFGAICEPINEIHLHVTWPRVYDNMISDNENHTDFVPATAPNWSLKIHSKDTKHLLGQQINQFLHICKSCTILNDLISDLLKRKNFSPVDVNVPASLSLSKIISGGNAGNSGSGNNETKRSKKFLPEDTLVSMLYYLFPDADADNTYPYIKNTSEDAKVDTSLKGMKTCLYDELPWRLSVIMCVIIHSYGEHAAAQFWYEFTQELRFRWDKSLKIPGVQKGVPNHKTSLLNQKLQMLNCCIQKRIKRENINAASDDSDDQNLPTKFESEDEEFFDCQTESKEMKEDGDNISRPKISLWNQPEGRLRKFNNLRLIETGDYMYIPITQEMTPKTEDQLEDDAVVLMKLGSDSHGSKLRARMMCASLYSDMESFKAANPGAILEDFIRWYSPRDWIEGNELDKYGQKKGKLSNRMLLPGNMWKEVWDNSIPVPACRQKCLFDDTKESEKVLHFFESRKNLSDVFSLLVPTLIHAGLYVVVNDATIAMMRGSSSSLDERIVSLVQKSVSATRNNIDLIQYKLVADEISDIEKIVMRYNSLQFKLFPEESSFEEDEKKMLIDHVLGQNEIIVPNGPDSKIGRRLIYLFAKEAEYKSAQHATTIEKNKRAESNFISSTNEALHHTASSISQAIAHHRGSEARHNAITTPPFQKEFVLYGSSSLPHVSSRLGQHNLTAHVCSEEIFLATNIIRDSVFV